MAGLGGATVAEVQGAQTEEEAIYIQAKIEPLVVIPPDGEEDLVGGRAAEAGTRRILALDIAYSTCSDLAVASGVLYRLADGKAEVIGERLTSGHITFPYLPGLLAFREVPLLARLIESMRSQLDDDGEVEEGGDRVVLLCDGAGIAHPRFCGLACHLGVLYGRTSIGVAKNHLAGDYDEGKVGWQRGSLSPLSINGRLVGNVVRSQSHIRPIFVSPGHCISTQQATDLVLQLCQKYRLPEPLRRADHIGRMELRRLEYKDKHAEAKAKELQGQSGRIESCDRIQ